MKLSEFDKITYEVNRGVALVTLNNPARRNAWGCLLYTSDAADE